MNKEDKYDIEDGGSAFPTTPTGETISGVTGGMTLRDWLAGQAMAGLLSNADVSLIETFTYPEKMARTCYALADSMLVTRKINRKNKNHD